MTTRRLTALLVSGVIAVGVLFGAVPDAGATTICSTAPNYCHTDADGVLAATNGAAVSGRVYWDHASYVHYSVTLDDRLRSNNPYAVLEVWAKTTTGWHFIQSFATSTSRTINSSVNGFGASLQYVDFRVNQSGESRVTMAVDRNQFGGE